MKRIGFCLFLIVVILFSGCIKQTSEQNDNSNQNFLEELETCKNQKLKLGVDLKECQNSLSEANFSLSNYKLSHLDSFTPPYTYIEGRTIHTVFKLSNGQLSHWTTPANSYDYFVTTEYFMNEFDLATLRWLKVSRATDYYDNYAGKYVKLSPAGQIKETINAVDYRPFVETKTIKSIADELYNMSSTDEEFVKEVFNMLKQITTYTEDVDGEAHFPITTLLSAGGDCEDTAILTASLLKAPRPDWRVDLVYMDANNPENPAEFNHVAVYVDTGEYATFIETTSTSEMSPYTKVVGWYFTV